MAKIVIADWHPIVEAVKTSAIAGGRDGEQLIATLRNQPECSGPMAGRGGLLASKIRRQATASRPLLAAAAKHYSDLVASVRKTADQEKYETARRAKIEVKQPSRELMEAIAAKTTLSTKLEKNFTKCYPPSVTALVTTWQPFATPTTWIDLRLKPA